MGTVSRSKICSNWKLSSCKNYLHLSSVHRCDENDPDDEDCVVPPTKVIGHYKRNDKDKAGEENGKTIYCVFLLPNIYM